MTLSVEPKVKWRLKACQKCGGDLVFDEEWVCLQCGNRGRVGVLPFVNQHQINPPKNQGGRLAGRKGVNK